MSQARDDAIAARRTDVERAVAVHDERAAGREAERASALPAAEMSEAIDRLRLKFSHRD